MPPQPPSEHDTASSGRTERLGWRALGIGSVLCALLAWLVPWNDFTLGNTFLYNNFLPPVVTLVLLFAALAVNPLLGGRRLRRRELAVICIMLLALGGVASSGLTRYLETTIAGTPQVLASNGNMQVLREELSAEQVRRARQRLLATERARLQRHDADGDGLLGAAESPFSAQRFAVVDDNADGQLSSDELADYRIRHDPDLAPDWRWAADPALFLYLPEAGPVPLQDPEYRYLVDGYLHSLPRNAERPRVTHRSRVRWRDASGTMHDQQALAGRSRDRSLRAGVDFLDLGDPSGGQLLRGRHAGERVSMPGGASAEIIAVEPPGVPWYAWLGPALAWSPLLFGAMLALVACAALVRRQWIQHERLPYPVGEVLFSLTAEPEAGRRLPALFRSKAFWTGFTLVAVIGIWKGLAAYHLITVDFALSFDLRPVFSGRPWNLMPDHWDVYQWRIYFSIIAIIFFLPLDISFSLWFTFLATHVFAMFMQMNGVEIGQQHISDVSAGGFGAMCLLVLWIGRRYYLAVLRAAFGGRGGDPAARAAAPWVWALLSGCALMLAFFVGQSVPIWAACTLILIFLGVMLVFGRIVAEAGVPFLLLPNASFLNVIVFTLVGFQLPVASLVPLTLVGVTIAADQREALLPYAINAGYIGERAKVPDRRMHLLIVAVAVLGAIVAGASMIHHAYTSPASDAAGHAMVQLGNQKGLGQAADGLRRLGTPEGAESLAEERGERVLSFASGAGLVALFGVARFAYPAWPLHPIGVLTSASWASQMIWFCFFLGWLAKFLTLRYGGTRAFQRLKPAAIGMIAAEATVLGVFVACKLIAHSLGYELPPFNILPG